MSGVSEERGMGKEVGERTGAKQGRPWRAYEPPHALQAFLGVRWTLLLSDRCILSTKCCRDQ